MTWHNFKSLESWVFGFAKFTYLSILRKCSRICFIWVCISFLKDLNFIMFWCKCQMTLNQKSLTFSENSKPIGLYLTQIGDFLSVWVTESNLKRKWAYLWFDSCWQNRPGNLFLQIPYLNLATQDRNCKTELLLKKSLKMITEESWKKNLSLLSFAKLGFKDRLERHLVFLLCKITI